MPPLRPLLGLILLALTLATPGDPDAARAGFAPGRPAPHLGPARGGARPLVFGSHSGRRPADGSRLDAALAELAAPGARPRNPALRVATPPGRSQPEVLVDATTRGDPVVLAAALGQLGLRDASVFGNDVGGWLPVAQLGAADALPGLASLRAASPHRRAGAVQSQGDFAQRSDLVRSAPPGGLTGAGITVGVLSDSYNCYATYAAPGSGVPASGTTGYAANGFLADAASDQAGGDLPGAVTVLKEADCLNYGAPSQLPYADEGRAMMQIVHDVAPGAALAFYTAYVSEADYANGILALAKAGAQVIIDDVGYYDEPYYQDGLIAQAIDTVAQQGVSYISSAGNNGSLSYENLAPQFTATATTGPNAGEALLNFDPSGATTTTALPVSIPALGPGASVAVIVHWDQPYVTGAPASGGATSRLDLCIGGAGGDQVADVNGNPTACTGANALGTDPVLVLVVGNPADAAASTQATTIAVTVGLAAGKPPGRIKVTVADDGQGAAITAFDTASATLQGHPGAAGAVAVGAAFYFDSPRCATTPATLETFSSRGGAPILFDAAGTRLATPVVRTKPDLVGPDGVNTTFLGYTLAASGVTGADGLLSTTIPQCQNAPAYPNFFGTSAAAPHVAGLAALLRAYNPALTATDIAAALRASALPIGTPTPGIDAGYGFVDATAVLAAVPAPPPPTVAIVVAPTTVRPGATARLTWAATGAASCVASGAWNGAEALSGTLTVTATQAGALIYTLSCSNAGGTTSASATLTATAPPTSGGGALDPALLALLALPGLIRRAARARRAAPAGLLTAAGARTSRGSPTPPARH